MREILDGGSIERSEDEYFSDLYEAAELVDISGAYAIFGDSAIERLQRAAQGSPSFSVDSAPDGRNVSFELSLAMCAHRSGAQVALPADGDVTICTSDYRFLAECKRPQSLRATKKNMEKAARQGARRVEKENDRTVVLIDASVALNPNFRIRRTNLPKDTFYRRAHRWVRTLTERDALRVNGVRNLTHIGILVRYSSFGIASGEMFHCQTWAVYPNLRLGSRAELPLRAFAALFDPSYGESSSNVAIF